MASPAPVVTIGELSRATACKVETIRYYERIGLLDRPLRSEGGHRHYPPPAVKRLAFIRRARALGFGIDAVRTLLALADGRHRTCAQVERVASRHLASVSEKLRDLAELEKVLKRMVAQCRGGAVPECPLIDALSEGAPSLPQPRRPRSRHHR